MNYYEVLGINEKAKYEEIRKAYHKMAFRYHPDKCQEPDAEEKFKKVVEAYEVLTDPVKRRRYDLSRKLNDNYDFTLPTDILKFSKYFFSEKNIQKFKTMGNVISQQAENFGISLNFEIMLHSFLNNIRNGKYHSLIEEYQLFKKFYETDNYTTSRSEENYEEELNKKQEQEYENRKNQCEKSVETLNETGIQKFNNKCYNVNIKVNLENVYQRHIKVAPLQVNIKCERCEGKGVVYLDNCNRRNKNSRSKYRKKNLSRKRNDSSFLDKKICSTCQGTGKITEEKRYLIDTSMDKICYLSQYWVNLEQPSYDLMFNIITKPHSLFEIEKNNRYNLTCYREISLSEFYYGSEWKTSFLDNTMLDIKWRGFNNGKFQNTIIIPQKGLLVIPDNNYWVTSSESIINNYKLDGCSRGDLKVHLVVKIPILNSIKLEEHREKIREISDSETLPISESHPPSNELC